MMNLRNEIDVLTEYYTNQASTGHGIYSGVDYQRGHGIGVLKSKHFNYC